MATLYAEGSQANLASAFLKKRSDVRSSVRTYYRDQLSMHHANVDEYQRISLLSFINSAMFPTQFKEINEIGPLLLKQLFFHLSCNYAKEKHHPVHPSDYVPLTGEEMDEMIFQRNGGSKTKKRKAAVSGEQEVETQDASPEKEEPPLIKRRRTLGTIRPAVMQTIDTKAEAPTPTKVGRGWPALKKLQARGTA